MSLTYEEITLPVAQVDKDNYSNLLLAIRTYNVVIILATVIPLVGTLITTILGALSVTILSNSTLLLFQTIISAITCFITAICTFLKNSTLNTVKDLTPTLRSFITIWNDNLLI
jgi:hypothetical protein